MTTTTIVIKHNSSLSELSDRFPTHDDRVIASQVASHLIAMSAGARSGSLELTVGSGSTTTYLFGVGSEGAHTTTLTLTTNEPEGEMTSLLYHSDKNSVCNKIADFLTALASGARSGYFTFKINEAASSASHHHFSLAETGSSYPADLLFYAKYDTTMDATYVKSGSVTATIMQGSYDLGPSYTWPKDGAWIDLPAPQIASSKLDLGIPCPSGTFPTPDDFTAVNYIGPGLQYTADWISYLNGAVCIRMKITPNFSYTADHNNVFDRFYQNVFLRLLKNFTGSWEAQYFGTEAGSGTDIETLKFDPLSTITNLANDHLPISHMAAGTEFEIEYNADASGSSLFYNGVLVGTGAANTNVISGLTGGMLLVGSAQDALDINVRELKIFNAVQHTTNYTPDP